MTKDNEKTIELESNPDWEQTLSDLQELKDSAHLTEEENAILLQEHANTFEDVQFSLLPSYEEGDGEKLQTEPLSPESEFHLLEFTIAENKEISLKKGIEIINPIVFRFADEKQFWLVDQPDEQIYRFSQFNGQIFINGFTVPRGKEQFCIGYPGNILLDPKGSIYILDVVQQSLHKFSSQGEYDGNFQDQVVASSPLLSVRDFDIKPSSNLLIVSDYLRGSLMKFTLDGREAGEEKIDPSITNGRLAMPTGVAFMPDMRHFALLPINQTLVEFSPEGKINSVSKIQNSEPCVQFFTHMAAGPGGSLFLADFHSQCIYVYDVKGKRLGHLCVGPDSAAPEIQMRFFNIRHDGRINILDPVSMKIHCLEHISQN
ncbi:MAG TPA: hypothetical protein PKW18_04395 [Candidatus Sumerlaeota bacterium]|nr:MAG: hypothetical protein BWY12_01395 [candidate division BRC1 bacterium ADurb.Bin183]HOE64514.1 hypothetical protein [Candidatus Sumerlaeota bacterium]HRR30059.1 hypothetical protein [Candidatus Sumerlaeia bacterium]HON51257.1 hypothetical protein [Candidatus Sumerlaeota bacterium]HOR64426.1 hypothetical protein [Candidatus Sumerlaeota bacterium]